MPKKAKTHIKDHITDHQNYNKLHKLYFYNDEVVKIERPKFTFRSIELKIHLWNKKSIYSKRFIFKWNNFCRDFCDENGRRWQRILSFEFPDAKPEIMKQC